MLRFIDIGGHEKYLKTALYGMTSLLPDYVLLCVNAHAHSASLPRASREHLAVALALEIPLAVVLTQVGDGFPACAHGKVCHMMLHELQQAKPLCGGREEVSLDWHHREKGFRSEDCSTSWGAFGELPPHVFA